MISKSWVAGALLCGWSLFGHAEQPPERMFEVLKVAEHALVNDMYKVDRSEMQVVEVSRHAGRWNPLTRYYKSIRGDLDESLDKPANRFYWLVSFEPRSRQVSGGGYSFLISDSDLSVFYVLRSK